MNNKNKFNYELIAPCGINCAICLGFLRTKNKCNGCKNNPSKCVIQNCDELKKNNLTYCYECRKFPCRRLKQLDKRYSNRYQYSILDALLNIKKDGIKNFIKNEEKKWICKECSGVICVHRGYCFECGKVFYFHEGNKRKIN